MSYTNNIKLHTYIHTLVEFLLTVTDVTNWLEGRLALAGAECSDITCLDNKQSNSCEITLQMNQPHAIHICMHAYLVWSIQQNKYLQMSKSKSSHKLFFCYHCELSYVLTRSNLDSKALPILHNKTCVNFC